MKKGFVDIWRWCDASFQNYRTQLCNDSDNVRFKFHFLLREMQKAVCAIRECKKKTPNSRGEKNEEIISRKCLPHHKKDKIFINKHKETRLRFLLRLSRYYAISESVQHDDQWSSLPDIVHFRYDDHHPSLPVERLIILTPMKILQQNLKRSMFVVWEMKRNVSVLLQYPH
jgi:hypothetical protein